VQALDILYIGSKEGPEKALCGRYDVPFAVISTGKLRRYFSMKNFTDPFRVVAGVFQAWRILRKWKPDVVFSKGGFVSVPVVLAAAKLHIPIIVHEADVTPGLANRICARFAKVVCVSWDETVKFFRTGGGKDGNVGEKILFTGMPVRAEIFRGVRDRGLKFLRFEDLKPILLVMGGSLGAKSLNSLVWKCLEKLVKYYNVVHLIGAAAEKSLVEFLEKRNSSYRIFPYLQDELADVYAATDVVVSRAGGGAIAELCALEKPTVLVPLGTSQSRGDQVVNANILATARAAEVIVPGKNDGENFVKLLSDLARNEKRRELLRSHMKPFGEKFRRAAAIVAEIILSFRT